MPKIIIETPGFEKEEFQVTQKPSVDFVNEIVNRMAKSDASFVIYTTDGVFNLIGKTVYENSIIKIFP